MAVTSIWAVHRSMDDIRQYYPRNMLPKDIVADIKNLLHKRRLEQMRRKENRDAR